MNEKRNLRKAAVVLGKRSYQVRLRRLGIERIRKIALQNLEKRGDRGCNKV
ncbi:MAG TPA: hypothetical protein VKV79_03180 [Terriglobia bacterium]|nr:hypothetical protein [Terriglobia bacterium]